ncbi:85/88 kDa calcium-independent phospholipase A2-like isoform X2 [Biomphalaria glabrata]|uniref:phospholipase A2 n=1 Tax=Biomphalaria glabrata TaxID=6526 RepID=A0A9W2ZL03_BIOGL|nr:85/88 kDa calcium-independent phospholipase A2-like isoform X2 [Biomphalaria glabrata]
MAAFLKNLATGFNDIVTAAQAKISPFTVQSATVDKFSQNGCVTTKQDGCLTLYRRTATIPTYECTITKPDMPTKIFSIFRQTVETEAVILYNSLLTMMLPIVNSCTVPCQEDYLQKLLDCIKEHPSWTCAHVAAYLGYHTCLKCPGIVDFIDSQCKTHQMTPLMVALIGKQALAAEELLRLGASLEKKDKNGDTAYHYAVLNCPPLVSLLVDYDHNGVINWLNGKGESALLIACERKLSEATEILIGSKADPRVATADCLPIHAAVRSCDMRSVEIIIQAYPDQANAKDFKYGSTPLHWAENVECIQRLALLGCDLNALNNEGNAPLHVFLATKKKTECLLALLCHGADCNIFDAIGETVLHKAIKNDDLELVRQFVVFGADVNLKTQHGFSPRHLASLSKGKKKDTILFLLHVSGAVRCDKTVKGCLPGCVVEGHYNGQPDQTMAALMKLDNVALFDEQLMATVVHSSRSSDLQGAVLDMTDAPVSMGDRYMKGLYVRLKDEVFKGSRPYDSGPFEEMLKREFGEYTLMGDIKHPKILVTAVLADRHPAELYFFRNFEKTLTHPKSSPRNAPEEEKNPWEQKVWEAARSSGAAPTYFRGYGPFLDGGLIANNPTLDVLTEIHEYNMGLSISKRGQEVRPIGCVISLGCGRIPCIDVQSTDVFRPSGPLDAYKAVMGASALGRLVVDQATISEGRVVDRARAWCSMISVPYYRFSPLLSEDVSLDCHDIKILINMLWETHCYMVANKHRLTELASLLRASLR